MDYTVTEIKNSINEFNTLDTAKKRIDGLEGTWVEFIQSESAQTGKREKAIFEKIMADNLTKFDKTAQKNQEIRSISTVNDKQNLKI